MSAPELSASNLQAWLEYIGTVHVTEIELGLKRVQAVANALNISNPAPTVITVAGTNGKGSVVACLESLLIAAGHSTGTYTSPHLEAFNERIRINGLPCADAEIIAALQAIDSARADISLSYFEFATLAALLLSNQHQVDVAILEVGLGGRLDAVNIVDPQVSIITSIDLDHQEWLGTTREQIALEKAGILRAGGVFICGDRNPPGSLLAKAEELQCDSYFIGTEFGIDEKPEAVQQTGSASVYWENGEGITHPTLELPEELNIHRDNAACALKALQLLSLLPEPNVVYRELQELQVPGRQEWRADGSIQRQILLDVAHNPAATVLLSRTLEKFRQFAEKPAQVIVVMAVMADKDIQDMACNLESHTDIWYIAQVDEPRCMPGDAAAEAVASMGTQHEIRRFTDVKLAYREACEVATENDLIVVTGSFYTVAEIRSLTRPVPRPY